MTLFLRSCSRATLFHLNVPCARRYHYPVRNGWPFKILFMGRDEFSCIVLQKLFESRDVWSEICVATYPDTKKGRRGSVLSVSPLRLKAEELGLPVLLIPKSKADFKHWQPDLDFLHPQDAAIKPSAQLPLSPLILSPLILTASFGRIISSALLNRVHPDRRLNVHPSLVPRYRGSAPIQHALMNGDKDTGVSVISMLKFKEGLDTGKVWGSANMPIPEDVRFESLRDTLAEEGANVLVRVLRDMRRGEAHAIPQDELGIPGPWPLAPQISIKDSFVDLSEMDAKTILRKHRAISHQRPLVAFLPPSKQIQLHDPLDYTHTSPPFVNPLEPGEAVYHSTQNLLLIGAANGTCLGVQKLKSENKALLPALDWWNGLKSMGLVDKFTKRARFIRPPPIMFNSSE